MVSIYINKKKFIVKKSNNLLQACLSVGQDIPYFCWHPALGSIGSCRQCAVTLYPDSSCKRGSIVMSCMTPVAPGMYLSISDTESKNFRKSITELFMLNHPHDCPICSEGGSCHLQDMVVLNKHYSRRYRFKKRIFSNQLLGPFIKHEMNRCITCYRCVRYYKDYAGGKDFGVFGSNNKIYFGKLKSGYLENEYSGNLLDICPTGVFTEKSDVQPFFRKWDLQYTPSICQHCSIGCNISIGERLGKISKIENRFNKNINKYFLCDLGRFGYGYSNSQDRPIQPYKKYNNKIKYLNYIDIIKLIKNIVDKKKNIIGIGSPRASIESNMVLYDLVGKENFSNGIPDRLYKCIDLIKKIIKNSSINVPSISEIETHDVIFIISEDITQTAARAALSVRQAIQNTKSFNISKKYNIPIWNVNAIKNIIQDKKNFLFILGLDKSNLDDISTWTYNASIDNQIKFAITVFKNICNPKNTVFSKDDHLSNKAYEIAYALSHAKKPLIISGTSSENINVIKIAFNIALSLKKKSIPVSILLFPAISNSFGVSLISKISLEKIFNRIIEKKINTIFILENNLYRYFSTKFLNSVFERIKNIIVLDHQNNSIVSKSNIFLPCANPLESSGTVVNYEMRAQRFFKSYIPYFYDKKKLILESWKWLVGIKRNIISFKDLNLITIDEIITLCLQKKSILKNLQKSAPKASFKLVGQKIARSPNRYTGRTSLFCKKDIHEPMSPKDLDTFYSFSMEGAQVTENNFIPKPFVWSPGWNSIQSLYRTSENCSLTENAFIEGVFLYTKNISDNISFFTIDIFKKEIIKKNSFTVVSYHCLLGSEETSQLFFQKYKYYNNIYIIINVQDANNLGVSQGEYLSFTYDDIVYKLPVCISYVLPRFFISLPLGRLNLPFSLLTKKITDLKKDK